MCLPVSIGWLCGLLYNKEFADFFFPFFLFSFIPFFLFSFFPFFLFVVADTVEQYLVDVILKVHPPSHSLGIFEGATDVPKELQTSMQASMSVLNYADPDMAVRSVQVESATDGQKKIPLVHVTLSTSSHSNAVKLSDILSKSSTVQKDFMGKSLTDAFHATKVSLLFFSMFNAAVCHMLLLLLLLTLFLEDVDC